MGSLQVPRTFKPRRPHKKSRNGCTYCRRRRIKCDESKPACLRCVNRNQPCEYFTQIQEYEAPVKKASRTASNRSQDSSQNSRDVSVTTPPLSASSLDPLPDFFDASPTSFNFDDAYEALTENLEPLQIPSSVDMLGIDTTKDLFLFDHYMNHTSRDLEAIPDVALARKFGIPQLAATNQGILCSVMALGAACMCIDLLSGQACCSEVENLSELISTGDQYHRAGMQSVQRQMTTNQPRDLAEAHAHTIILLPYALARRRISHLLNDIGPPTPTPGVDSLEEHLSSVEWMIILRGVTTTGRACWSSSTVSMDNSLTTGVGQAVDPFVSAHIIGKLSHPADHSEPWVGPRSRLASKHVLFPVIGATRVVAMDGLRQKVEKVNQMVRDRHRKDPALDLEKSSAQLAWSLTISACFMAVDLLVNMESTIFDYDPKAIRTYPDIPRTEGASVLDHPLPWLRRYASLPVYDPELLALRTIFSWVNSTPEEYFQLLLKPLPGHQDAAQNLSDRLGMPDIDREIQLLAWDIWAHWLVFAILIEGESFFTASLGVPDIINLSHYFRRTVPQTSSGSKPFSPTTTTQVPDWWPWSMCSVAQQLRRYDGDGLPTGS